MTVSQTRSTVQLSLLLLSLVLYSSFNIEIEYKTKMTVIAGSGLNLRSEPGINSKILVKVPFGTKVITSSDEKALQDTLILSSEKTLINKWFKTQFKGQHGYLFGSFLFPSESVNNTLPPYKPDYKSSLLLTGCTCANNFQMDETLNWYGIFKENGSFKTRIVTPSYYTIPGAIVALRCCEAIEDKNILFMVGTHNTNISAHDGQSNFKTKKSNYTITSIYDESDPINEDFYIEDYTKLTYCLDNKNIVLNTEIQDPVAVLWKGDLNDDGIKDLIIQFGGKSARIILYLSDKSDKINPFNAVAEFNEGICC